MNVLMTAFVHSHPDPSGAWYPWGGSQQPVGTGGGDEGVGVGVVAAPVLAVSATACETGPSIGV